MLFDTVGQGRMLLDTVGQGRNVIRYCRTR